MYARAIAVGVVALTLVFPAAALADTKPGLGPPERTGFAELPEGGYQPYELGSCKRWGHEMRDTAQQEDSQPGSGELWSAAAQGSGQLQHGFYCEPRPGELEAV